MKRLYCTAVSGVLLILALAFSSDMCTAHAGSAVIIVDDDGSAGFSTIQDAINAAAEGDVVFVRNGTYHENVVVNKTISLVGQSREASVVDGDQKEFAMVLVASGVTVSSLTLRNTSQTNSTHGCGITASNVTDCLIQDSIISRNYYGVRLFSCANFTLKGNWVVDNGFFGVALEDSPLCTINDSVIQGNMYTGINVTNSDNCKAFGNSLARSNRGIAVKYSASCAVGDNFIEKTVYYGIEVISSSDVWIGNNSVNGNFHVGISVRNSVNCTVIQNDASNNRNYYGLEIASSSGCKIAGNTLADNFFGLMLERSGGCEVSGNEISGSSIGVQVYSSDDNRISGNTVSNVSDYAVFISSSNGCSIDGNTIRDNRYYGIWMYNSSGSTFFHNNLVNNSYHAFADGLANSWNQSIEGNYWSKYAGADMNQDGIGDTAYTIAANNVDHHPLLGTFSSFTASQGLDVNVISNSTVYDFAYDVGNETISFNVNGTDGTRGFCRVCIPHALMNETYHATVDGAEPASANYTLFDDGEKRWIYFVYVHSPHEVEIVPEVTPVTSLLLLTFSAVAACALCKKRFQARR